MFELIFLLMLCQLGTDESSPQVDRSEPVLIDTWRQSVKLHTPRFKRLSLNDGLSNAAVFHILQDADGFIWMATKDGLNRFDGLRFEVYRHREGEPDSLAENRLLCLLEDREKRLWIGGWTAGPQRFDKQTQTFYQLRLHPDYPQDVDTGFISSMVEGEDGDIWFGTRDGVIRYHQKLDRISHYRLIHEKEIGEVLSLHTEPHRPNLLWIGSTEHGLLRLNTFTGELAVTHQETGRIGEIHIIITGHQEELWLAGLEGLGRYQPSTGEYRHLNDENPDIPVNIDHLMLDYQGILWMADRKGITLLNLLTNEVHAIRHDPIDPTSLAGDQVRHLFRDHSGILWIAHDTKGVSMYNEQDRQYRRIVHHPIKPDSLLDDEVWDLLQNPDGSFWVGTSKGLNYISADQTIISGYSDQSNQSDQAIRLLNRSIYTLHMESENRLWMGGDRGVQRLNLDNNTLDTFQNSPDDPNSLSPTPIWKIVQDYRGLLWIGLFQSGVNILDPQTDQILQRFEAGEGRQDLTSNTVIAIQPDTDQKHVWLGTFGGGLNRINLESGIVKAYRHQSQNPHSISHDAIYDIYQDKNGHLWLGTDGGGLNRFDPITGQAEHWTVEDGLPNNAIRAIQPDFFGFIWCATLRGLAKFDPVTEQFQSYGVNDGMLEDTFNLGSMQTQQGELVLTTNKGLLFFRPEDLNRNLTPPKVAIVDLEVFNKPVDFKTSSLLDKPIQFAETLTLDYQTSVFSLEFAALHFAAPEANRFNYRLNNFESDWQSTTARRPFATYTNLDPGEYVFELMAANKDGVWRQEARELKIVIESPPWATWWAKTSYVLIFAGLFALVEYTRLRRKRQLQLKNKELADTNDELRTVDDIVKTINREVSLRKVLTTLLEQGLRLFPKADRGGVLLWRPEKQAFVVAASVNHREKVDDLLFDREEIIERYTHNAEEVFPQIYVIRNFNKINTKLASKPKSVLTMAMSLSGSIQGFVIWDSFTDVDAFNETDAQRLERFREHAVSAVSKAYLLQSVNDKNDEILRTRDQLVLQEKMASLGALTTGIAHEIRNPLNFINNFADITQERFQELREQLEKVRDTIPADRFEDIKNLLDELGQNAAIIGNHGNRAGEIVENMLAVAEPRRRVVRSETKLNEMVEEFTMFAINSFQSQHGDVHVVLDKHFDPKLDHVDHDLSGLERVLINVITNALESLLERFQADEPGFSPSLWVSTQVKEEGFCVAVRDNGVGLPERNQDQIFHPFFTTKSPQGGNIGLGLSISFDIVTGDLGGVLTAETAAEGAIFTIKLPFKESLVP